MSDGRDVVLRDPGLVKRFGGITATNDVSLQLAARRAPCADRPQRRRQDDADQPADRRARADARAASLLDGEDITRLAPHRRVRRGLVRTFQINQLFASTDAAADAGAGGVAAARASARSWWRPLGARRAASPTRCEQLLRAVPPGRRHGPARPSTLAYGKRRLLEIAIALACEPRVLLLDEPVAGVPAGEREEICSRRVAALPADVSVLLIEHDMDLVFSFADAHDGAGQRRACSPKATREEIAQRPARQGGVPRQRGARMR